MRLWDAHTGKQVSVLDGELVDVVWSVAFAADGAGLAIAGCEPEIQLCKLVVQ